MPNQIDRLHVVNWSFLEREVLRIAQYLELDGDELLAAVRELIEDSYTEANE